ncbi:MAG: TA system VapC family ribonuclease toxin [Candidatus Sulfotelmatobacter sp.]
MSVFLLDANLLIALAWPEHEAHNRAGSWFARHSRNGWATCPFTQAAFVRILSNPAFSPRALSPQNAAAVLAANLKLPGHRFWPDSLPIVDAIDRFGKKISGHRQITDAYLLALSIYQKGRLATMDESIASLGDGVELVPRFT